MNLKKENDFVIKVKTPTSLVSKHISLGDKNNRRSVSQTSKSSKHQQSSQSLSYSDSFDSDSPVKNSAIHRVKRNPKPNYQASSFQSKKIKKAIYGIPNLSKAGESTQKLLEANQLEINELISENADLRRQLFENTNELKTVQNQNKIQERYLNKVNSRDADVPNIISRYNSELHSLQEQLRRKKESLDMANRQKMDLDLGLGKAKKKIEKLKSLVADKQLQEREELAKKILNLTETLDTEVKKNTDLERSMELMTKKHAYQMTSEASKFKELKQSYTDALLELKNIRSCLKEKTKLLEMQNIYSKRVVRAPHRLSSGQGKRNEIDESNFSVSKVSTVPPLKSSIKKENKNFDNTDQTPSKPCAKIKYSSFKKYENNSITAVASDIQNDKKLEENKKSTKVLFYGDTPSEISDVEEKSDTKFSDIFETVRRNMQSEFNADNNNKEDDAQKNELLAKLKMIDECKMRKSGNNRNNKLSSVEENSQDTTKDDKDSDTDDLDVFCTSDSDSETYSDKKSNSSSPSMLLPRGHAGLMGSKKILNKNIKKDTTQFEFLGFSINSNNSNSEGDVVVCHTIERNLNYSSSDCEEIKID